MQFALSVAGAYLIGSVSFAIMLSRLAGIPDPRSYGSGNPGATNVLRTGRKRVAALTVLGDGGKGWLAVWVASLVEPSAMHYAGIAALLGHLFPVFHGFKGGKGVATAGGVLLAFDWVLGLAAVASWLALFALFRISSLAALVAAIFAPAYAFWAFGLQPVFPATIVIAVLLIWRHQDNLRRLARGEEGRVGGKPTPPQDPSAGAP